MFRSAAKLLLKGNGWHPVTGGSTRQVDIQPSRRPLMGHNLFPKLICDLEDKKPERSAVCTERE